MSHSVVVQENTYGNMNTAALEKDERVVCADSEFAVKNEDFLARRGKHRKS